GNHHTFTNSAWSGTASLHGGGADLLVSTADKNTTLTDTSLGYANGGSFTLAGITDAHLTGGAGDNTFDVKGWTHNATIDGAAGTDTILSANNASYTLSNTQLSESSGASFALANVEKANLTGAASDTTFDVSGWTGSGSLTGQAGKNNTVIASNDADFTLTN